jgi:hypothetical protein
MPSKLVGWFGENYRDNKCNVDSLRVQKVKFSNKRRPRPPRAVETMMMMIIMLMMKS